MTKEEIIDRYKNAYLKLASGNFNQKDVRDYLIILDGEMMNLKNIRKELEEKNKLIKDLMAKDGQLTLKDLKVYKFDTSNYVIINDGLKRDPKTGLWKGSMTFKEEHNCKSIKESYMTICSSFFRKLKKEILIKIRKRVINCDQKHHLGLIVKRDKKTGRFVKSDKR